MGLIRPDTITWFYTSTYDFSSFLSSEISEIRKHTTLEQYAKSQLIEEREHIFQRARMRDERYNREVLQYKYEGRKRINRRYKCLEDALRHLLVGVCAIGTSVKTALYVLTDGEVWCLEWIPRADEIYVPNEETRYSQEYLYYLHNQGLTSKIGKQWYDGNKDDKIKANFRWGEKKSCKKNNIRETCCEEESDKNEEIGTDCM